MRRANAPTELDQSSQSSCATRLPTALPRATQRKTRMPQPNQNRFIDESATMNERLIRSAPGSRLAKLCLGRRRVFLRADNYAPLGRSRRADRLCERAVGCAASALLRRSKMISAGLCCAGRAGAAFSSDVFIGRRKMYPPARAEHACLF